MMRYAKNGWNQGEPTPLEVHTQVSEDRPQRGKWLLEKFGSVEALAEALDASPALTRTLLGEEPDDLDDDGPRLRLVKG